MTPPPRTARVLGFGQKVPDRVLQFLSRAVAAGQLQRIQPQRSPGLEADLLAAPYRTFLENPEGGTPSPPFAASQVWIYQLPKTIGTYVKYLEEANLIRQQILSLDQGHHATDLIMVYSAASQSFLGLPAETDQEDPAADVVITLLQALGQERSPLAQTLAQAAWAALAELDHQAASAWLGRRRETVLLIGSGGREHALAVALARSVQVERVLCLPGNGGTAVQGGKISNIAPPPSASSTGHSPLAEVVMGLVQREKVALVVVGPEAPLVEGLVDFLADQCPDVMVFGPTQAAAQLEASKAFCKDFLQQHGIPTASYRTFTDAELAKAYVESIDPWQRQVVKASGLAAGKGVLLPETKEETIQAIQEVMSDKAFGAAGDTCVIESYLIGPEASCLAFCDGKTAKLMPAAQDHKRALDHDEGLNTGGMGAYAPAPCVTPALHRQIEDMCILTVQKMAERGTPYVGILYAGMMLTPDGPHVLEFNCRFGDPETQVLLPLLETDLYEVMTACCRGTLSEMEVEFTENTCAATVVCAAQGYPQSYPSGMSVTGLEEAHALAHVEVYHAGTQQGAGSDTVCSGGRVLAVTGIGSNLKAALTNAYNGVSKIDFIDSNGDSQMHFRTDIGRKAVEKKLRIGVLGSTRGTALVPVMEACANGSLAAEIVAVVSNKSTAPILEKGRSLGPAIHTQFVSSKGLAREQYDAECTAALLNAGAEFVLLVGYMRILSKPFTDFWKGRCINVHPSLLPKHAGGMDLAVHQAVIDAEEEETGCTIHQVTDVVDGGPILVQKKVSVQEGETAESLKAKVQALEGPAFIEAIAMYCRGKTIRYADAGVSIDAGNELVDLIKPFCKATRRPGCDAELGGFGGLFDLAAAGYNASDTVLIGATDGVGTKLRIAQATRKHSSIGIDLVAMCVNDLIVAGGEPLFFLDYFATGHLDTHEAAAVVRGIAEGCKEANCGLIGGETAEMPSMYAPGDYDLAGFAVGAVNRDSILPRNICVGDVLLGLASSGIHSNGYSLVRKLVEKEGLDYKGTCPWDTDQSTIGDALLVPTRIYVKSCLPLIKDALIKGMAHITGGGLLENLPRSLPEGIAAEISYHPPLSGVFKWLRQASGLDDGEMLRTFNCGIGMVLIVSQDHLERAREALIALGESVIYELGSLVPGERRVVMKVTLD